MRASPRFTKARPAIQANDLIGRKTARDGGAVAYAVCAEIAKVAAELGVSGDGDLKRIGTELTAANAALRQAIDWVVPAFSGSTRAAHAASVPYLRLWGLVAGGWQLARGAHAAAKKLAEGRADADFYRGKIATARFYADCLLPQAAAWSQAITQRQRRGAGPRRRAVLSPSLEAAGKTGRHPPQCRESLHVQRGAHLLPSEAFE